MLREFYEEHDPENLPEVDDIIQRYVGNEPLLWRNLNERYGIAPDSGPPSADRWPVVVI